MVAASSSSNRTFLAVARAYLLCLAAVPALAAAARAQEAAADGLFVTVRNPITSEVTNRVKQITDRAIQRWRSAAEADRGRAFRVVYDFNPNGQAAGTIDFGPCHDLAKYLLGLQDVTTVAFVRNEVTRHTVLPVLACKEIVMSREASLGDVLREPVEPLDPSERLFYLHVAERRNLPAAVVLKMLDKDVTLHRAKRLGDQSVSFVEGRVAATAKNGVAEHGGEKWVVEAEPALGAGPQTTLFSSGQAREFGLRRLLKESRQEVAEAYGLHPSALREDPLMGRNPVAWRVEVKGAVNAALDEGLRRRIRSAIGHRSHPANLLILELRCGGGDTQVARDLADFLRNLADTDGSLPVMTVAYIPENAPDTATYLALGCTEVVMHKGARLGDFSSVLNERRDGKVVELGADAAAVKPKMESLMGLARAQGYSPLLVQGMFDRRLALYQVTSTKGPHEWAIVTGEQLEEDKRAAEPKWGNEVLIKEGGPNGRPLVLGAEEARKLGLARHVVEGLPEVYAAYGLKEADVRAARSDWLDHLAAFLSMPAVAVILVMVGITCLILELKLPGIGIPGVVAAVCFVLFFWSHAPQLSGQMTMLAVLLFALGLVLLALEIFVLPGFGVPGISGVILVLGSIGLVAYGHWPQTRYEWAGFARALSPFFFSLIGAVVCGFLLARYLPNIPYANRLLLRPAADEGEFPGDAVVGGVYPDYSSLLGAIGVAATPLRPAGKVQFGEDFVDVTAEGSYIEAGMRVQVIEIEGNRVVVKEV